MKKMTLLLGALLAFAPFSATYSQQPPSVSAPPGASDRGPDNRDIKTRSLELERIARDAAKPDGKNQPSERMPLAKFQEIKEDFESIQRLQNEIVTAYTMSKQIDYAKIAGDAGQINKNSIRLESNLFPVTDDRKNKKKSKEQKTTDESVLPQDLKMIIVELDNTLAAFVGNAMFTNPKVVNPADNAKARSDIGKIITLSAALKLEAERTVKQ